MNMLFIKHIFVVFMVSEIPRVSVFGYFPLLIKHIYKILILFQNSLLFYKFL